MSSPTTERGRFDGVVVVDKPGGWTSHDVVAKIRGILGTRRCGHAGTLDPDATGVLVVGVGRATRLLRFATALPKSYIGEIVLGTTTSTLDASGTVTGTFDMSAITLDAVREVAGQLTGRILQTPPMVSAVKIAGRRLHELARAGVEVERKPRPVEVFSFRVDPTNERDVYRIAVECSSGTYVRQLAADLGAALGGGAHLRSLRRTAVGGFSAAEAVPLDVLGATDVRPMGELVAHLSSVAVAAAVAAAVAHGRVLSRQTVGATGDGPWAVYDESGRLLAVYELLPGERLKPLVVVCSTAPGGDARRGE
jgi:tRNA pseudouridine55 synthase